MKKLPFIALIAGVAYWVMTRGKHEEREEAEQALASIGSDTSPSGG